MAGVLNAIRGRKEVHGEEIVLQVRYFKSYLNIIELDVNIIDS